MIALAVVEQPEAFNEAVSLTKAELLKIARSACRICRRLNKGSHAFLPRSMRLQGTYELLRGKPGSARKW